MEDADEKRIGVGLLNGLVTVAIIATTDEPFTTAEGVPKLLDTDERPAVINFTVTVGVVHVTSPWGMRPTLATLRAMVTGPRVPVLWPDCAPSVSRNPCAG